MNQPSDAKLQRTIGAKSLALNAMNLTIGAGIFVVPALVAEKLGPASLIAYLICASLMVLVMLCFAEVGSKVTSSGGAYAYVEHAFGSYAGFLINVLFWLGYAVVSDAAIANAMADMIGVRFPAFNDRLVRTLFFVLLFAFFSYVNIKGVKSGERLMVVNTLFKLIPLVILIVIGLFNMKSANFAVESWPEFKSYGEMALILFFAFVGTESALGNSGEIKNPQRNIPKGIFMGLAGILIFYLLIQTVTQGVLGTELPNNLEAPLAVTAQKIMGDFGFSLIMLGGIISIYGMISGDILATPRMVYAGSKDGLFPKFLSNLHPKFNSPYYAIILFAVLIVMFASIGEFKQLALVASSAILIVYLAVALAVIKLRFNNKKYPNTFRIPGGLLIPILAIGVIGWFISHTSMDEIIAILSFFVLSSMFYLIYSRKHIRKDN